MTYTETVANIINTDEIDTSIINETVAEAVKSTSPKGFYFSDPTEEHNP